MAGPAELVTDGYERFVNFAEQSFSQTTALLSEIDSFAIPSVSVNVQYNAPSANPTPFTLPPEPDAPEVEFNFGEAPELPNLNLPAVPNFSVAPQFNKSAPNLSLPPRPAALSIAEPGPAPEITDPDFPDAPVLAYPNVPALREITLPDAPMLMLPAFTDDVPALDIQVPTVGFSYTETPYSSLLLSDVTSRVRTMLQGGTGLPAPVENALFERAKGRLDMTLLKATQEAVEQWTARGFSEPGGELAARLREVREQNRDAVNNLNRDILIRVHEVEIENLRFAVQQGIALESLLIQYAAGYAQRALEAQRLTVQLAIDVFNARIALYNAALVGYRARVDVYRALVEAERVKIETFRTQVEAAVAASSLNESLVRIYAEQVRALETQVDIYEAQIRGVTARVQADQARVEGYRATIQAYAERYNAKRSEFEAYGEEVRAQIGIIGGFEAETRAYAERVRAYAVEVETGLAPRRFELERNRQVIETFQARLGAFRETVNAEATKAQAATAVYDGQARVYSARLGAEGARVEATSRQFQLEVENARTQAEIALRNATTNAENALRAAGLALESLRTQATVLSQVAAGSLSAVNLSAGISGNSSDSKSLSVSYSVDGGEAAPPAIP